MFLLKISLIILTLSIYDGLTITGNYGWDNIKVPYTLWIGDAVDTSTSIDVWAKNNSTFYEVMKLAADLNPTFKFEANESSFGHFVTKIAGYEQNPEKKLYWFIYVLRHKPFISFPPGNDQLSNVGVDGIFVRRRRHYLFWYKTWQEEE